MIDSLRAYAAGDTESVSGQAKYAIPKSWTNEKVAALAYLAGRGHTGREIARVLDESVNTVKRVRLAAGLPDISGPDWIGFRIPLDNGRRAELNRQASGLGITPAEFIRRILICVLEDRLYENVVDGRFK